MRVKMSDNNEVAVVEITHDFSQKDLNEIMKYKEEGMPDIYSIDDKRMSMMMDMYLSGRNYRQISMTMSTKKIMIMYLAHRFNWFQLRKEYMEDMEANIRARKVEAAIQGQDFMLQLQAMWQKKIGTNVAKYLATNNEEFANNIDLKEVDKLIKVIEMLHKPESSRGSGNGNPAVGLNLGEGVTIVKNNDNSVEITPKTKVIGNALKQLADFRRQQETKK
jgi:hypothetical protein